MFDRIVVVDWSANSTPKTGRDSIWVAECLLPGDAVADGSVPELEVRSWNVPTRHEAIDHLADAATAPGRTLIGVDFSLGFPAGTAAALGLDGVAWHALWQELARQVDDDERNVNNRFEVGSDWNSRIGDTRCGPFWGCPPARATGHLTTTKVPADPLAEWRTVESVLRERGHRPFSCWQLLGAGAVGSQTLLGIPAVAEVADRVRSTGRTVDVWPFTSGLAVPAGDVVLAEVWPTLIQLPDPPTDPPRGHVRDRVQVETLARRFAEHDLAPLFTPDVPDGSVEAIVGEEGWVLGFS